jgi:hypothetical protein
VLNYFRDIISLNERFTYALTGRLRDIILPFFNSNLNSQAKNVKKILFNNLAIVKGNMLNNFPDIHGSDLNSILTKECKESILFSANKALNLEFELLSKQVKFDNQIDWNLDFVSGYKWPKGKLYSKYDQVDINNTADVKYPRELSRCHHLLYLGEAYLITKDEKYTKEYVAQIKSWIKENPYKKSINWGCSMDIAIRAGNWVYALNMFKESSFIDDDFLLEIMTSLYLHGRFIYENPEKNRVYNHNHYISDLAGQILVGLLFQNIKTDETSSWKENGIYELYREIRIQILPSGFSYERSTNYHRLVTELISYTIILLKNNAIEVPQDIFFRVKKMFESILYYSYSNGKAPIIGDQDNGRFLPFYSHDINYQKYLMNVGAVLFDDQVFKNYSSINNLDVFFLFGKKGLLKHEKIKSNNTKLNSKSFSDAGFYILRSNKVYLFINNSGLSHYNEVLSGTHTHSDLLSFVYSYDGLPFLIDPGTFVYSSNPSQRKKFRSTSMHNTLTFDGYDQNDLNEKDIWFIKRDAIPSEVNWDSNEKFDIYEGSHSGYERLEDPVSHNRKFKLNKENDNLEISDKILCSKPHTVVSHLHFDENIEVEIVDQKVFCKNETSKIKISFKISEDLDYLLELKKEFISKSYNHKVLAPYVTVTFKIDKEVELKTYIQNDL